MRASAPLPVSDRDRPAFTLRAPIALRSRIKPITWLVGQRVSLHVHDRLGEAGTNERIAEVVHVDELVHVDMAVHGRPGAAQLDERVGAVGRECQHPARHEYPTALGESPVRVVGPVQCEVAENHVDAAVPQRQAGGIGTDPVKPAEEALATGRPPQHGLGDVDRQDPAAPVAPLQFPRGASGTGAKIHDHRRVDAQEVQPLEEFEPYPFLQHRRFVVPIGRAIK